jgi:hypothetical protein
MLLSLGVHKQLWLRKVLEEIGEKQIHPTMIFFITVVLSNWPRIESIIVGQFFLI